MTKIVALLGDYYHPFESITEGLERVLSMAEQAKDAELLYISAHELADHLNEGTAAVVIYKEDRINPQDEQVNTWMTRELAAEIKRYVEKGGAWLAWHSGLAGYEPYDDYVGMTRGYFLSHPSEMQVVSYHAPGSPDPEGAVVTDVEPFAIKDEHYFVNCDQENTNVFLVSDSVDGSSLAGWQHGYGNGKVCCFTPAHTKEGLSDPVLTKLLSSKVDWLLS